MAEKMENIIQTSHLTKRYGSKIAVKKGTILLMVPFCTLEYSLVQAVPTVNTQTSRNIFFFLFRASLSLFHLVIFKKMV